MFRCRTVRQLTNQQSDTRYTATAIDHMFANSIINTEIKSAIKKADIPDNFPKQSSTF